MLLDKIWEVDFAIREDLGGRQRIVLFGKIWKREWILLLHKIWKEVDFVIWEDFRKRSGRKVNVLFNNTLNTFYFSLYGVRHMVKDHSDSERGNPLPLLFLISSKGSFICIIPQKG